MQLGGAARRQPGTAAGPHANRGLALLPSMPTRRHVPVAAETPARISAYTQTRAHAHMPKRTRACASACVQLWTLAVLENADFSDPVTVVRSEANVHDVVCDVLKASHVADEKDLTVLSAQCAQCAHDRLATLAVL